MTTKDSQPTLMKHRIRRAKNPAPAPLNAFHILHGYQMHIPVGGDSALEVTVQGCGVGRLVETMRRAEFLCKSRTGVLIELAVDLGYSLPMNLHSHRLCGTKAGGRGIAFVRYSLLMSLSADESWWLRN